MNRSFLLRTAVLAALLFGPNPFPAAGATPVLNDPIWEKREVAAGVVLLEGEFDDLFGGPQVIKILRVNLSKPGVRVRIAAADPEAPRRALVAEFVEPTGAVAAVNGGFFGGGRGESGATNSGIFKIDGKVRPFSPEETDEYYFVGAAAIGIDSEGNWHFRNRPDRRWPADWPEMEHALAGGHRLIEDGEIHPSISRLATAIEARHAGGRHPRTAVGLLPDDTGLILTVDGRHPGNAEGMTLDELAVFLLNLGCVEALNLDGGGSTTMWIRDVGVINHPSGNGKFDRGGARRVFSAVTVHAETAGEVRE